MLGGYYSKDERQLNACTRYNIVSEKWQSLPPMIFPRENAAACAINETQVIVAGGRSAGGQLTDSVELYDRSTRRLGSFAYATLAHFSYRIGKCRHR